MTTFAASTHTGLKRDHNEDCYHAVPVLGLWLVADGVGGHANGEVASAIVRDTIQAKVAAGAPLIDAIVNSHNAVLAEIGRRGNSNMGSTVVALHLPDENYEVAWVGDSRAYVFNGELRQLTRDHNPVSELLARGAITPEQAASHPDRNVLSQSLGVAQGISVAPERIRGQLLPGQQLLLCSDGLTDELNDEAIAAEMRGQSSPQDQVDALVTAALRSGGRDNITVIVVGNPADPHHQSAQLTRQGEPTQEIDAATGAGSDNGNPASHDSKVWLLMAIMGLLAVVWVLLKILQ
jgi:protein phosphatase